MFWNVKKFTTCEDVQRAEGEFNKFKTLVECHTGKIVKVVDVENDLVTIFYYKLVKQKNGGDLLKKALKHLHLAIDALKLTDTKMSVQEAIKLIERYMA